MRHRDVVRALNPIPIYKRRGVDWDGSRNFLEFRRLVDDISAILGRSPTAPEAEDSRWMEEEGFREKEQRSEEEAKRKAEKANRRRIGQEVPNPWRTYGPVVAAVAVALIIFSFVFWWPKRQATERVEKQQPEKQITTQSLPVIGKVVRDLLKNGEQGPEMVVIPAGSFHMGDLQGGDQYALPIRTVRIQKPFDIGRYEVTFEKYDQFATAAGHWLPHDSGWGRGRRPVINVL